MLMAFMLMIVTMLMAFMLMIVTFMIVAVTTAITMLIMMMVMMFIIRLCLGQQILHHRIRLLDQFKQLRPSQLPDRGRHNRRRGIMLPQHLSRLPYLTFLCHIRAAQHNRPCILYLIIKKLSEILHVHPALISIHYSHGTVQTNLQIFGHIAHRIHHIRKLAHTGRFDNHPIRAIFRQHLLQRFSKISYQRAADTAGIHFPDLNPRILQKAAVNPNLSELILNQNHLLSGNGLLEKLFNKGRLTCS